jgi:hypothetical protein
MDTSNRATKVYDTLISGGGLITGNGISWLGVPTPCRSLVYGRAGGIPLTKTQEGTKHAEEKNSVPGLKTYRQLLEMDNSQYGGGGWCFG